MKGDVTYILIADCNEPMAAMYGEVALAAVQVGDTESAYYFARLAAHKALYSTALLREPTRQE